MEARREELRPSGGGDTSFREPLEEGGVEIDFSSREWVRAQRRLILYLQFLKIPPFEVLELALEALKRARQSQEVPGENPPVTAAMRALRQLLLHRQSSYSRNSRPSTRPEKIISQVPVLEDEDISRGVKSMPSVNRGVMVPTRSR
jgi:hypothetical protein